MRRLLNLLYDEHGGAAAYLTADGMSAGQLRMLRLTLVSEQRNRPDPGWGA
jgi:hypothetical protein